jgi:hypothetical protein
VAWQSKLDPHKAEMESTIAALAGAPYRAREVSFKLPDFVDIVLNAGDSRAPSGATVGQSLPNFGPVANEGRGRTVAMTNFYTDADSRAAQRAQAASLLCPATMSSYTDDDQPMLVSSVLHEASHNLGPAHQYLAPWPQARGGLSPVMVNGRTDRESFGGPLASILEELKAQTSAIYFTDWLVGKQLLDGDFARKAHVKDVTWAFGHISRGMYDAEHHPLTYSQVAAIQIGHLVSSGAIAWRPDTLAANGSDRGCFEIDSARVPEAVVALEREVLRIKATGDKPGAERLIRDYVDATGERERLLAIIAERMQRVPKASFVYSVRLDGK